MKRILVFATQAILLLTLAPFHIPVLHAIDFTFETTGGVEKSTYRVLTKYF